MLKKLPKYTKIPKIVFSLDPTEEEFKEMIARFPFYIVRAMKDIFENGDSISIAAKSNKTSIQLIRYYINKMHKMKKGE